MKYVWLIWGRGALLPRQPGRSLASHMNWDPICVRLKQEKIASKVRLRIFMDPTGLMYVSPK